jgi:hypothetical protein
MPFTLIRGTYHIKGYEPDGDSVRFAAANSANWAKLAGRVDVNARGHAQLRLEAIDTLETHFNGQHQPLALATKALQFLLRELKITGAQFDPLMSNVVEARDGTPGYIIARQAEKNGRPVAFAFSGTPPESDGSTIFLTPRRVKDSLNHKSLVAGLAYPTYYTGLFPDLRTELTSAVAKSRLAKREIWAEDVTNAGFAVRNLQSVTDTHVILPKLFRRLVEFMRGGGSVGGFKEFMQKKAEPITLISTAHFTHFDTIIDVRGTSVKLTQPPENVIFLQG